MAFPRQTAIPCTLLEIKNSAFLQNDGPSGVQTSKGFVGRASILGVVVEKYDNGITLEDGTASMRVRSFDPVPIYAGVGDLVLVIGRPREFSGERYLVFEICKRLKNPAWVQYRKRELELFECKSVVAPAATIVSRPTVQVVTVPAGTKNPYELVAEKVRELDAGNGADIEEVLAALENNDGTRLIKTLLEEGELFEIHPGRLKVLE